MKVALAVSVVAVASALALAERAGRAPLPRPVAAVTATAAPGPALPVITRDAGARLRVSDPRTLEPVGPAVALPERFSHGVLSPDGRTAAYPSNERLGTELRLFDVERNRVSAPIDVGGAGPLEHLTWLTDTRLAVFSGADRGGSDLVEIERGRVVERSRFAGEPIVTARRREGMVALLAPPGRIGRARLLIVGPRGQQSQWPLRLRAGFQRARPDGLPSRVANVQPGLAVDPGADVVHVVDAEEDRLHTIDLRNETGVDVSLGPVARAAKEIDSRVRQAAWLGGGRLAIAGRHERPDGRIEPFGLRIVDVGRPERPQVMVARDQSWLAAGEGRVLSWGRGLVIHDRRGRVEHRLLESLQVVHVHVAGPYAYVSAMRRGGRIDRTRVVDLHSGRVVGTRRASALHITAAASAAREPVLGVSYPGGPRGRIAFHDPVTLEPTTRTARVPGHLWDADRSPRGWRIALAISSRGRVQIVDLGPMRHRRTIRTGRRETITALRWAARDRIVAITHEDALELSMEGVVGRRPLGGRPLAWGRTADGLAVLVAPADGDAWIVLLRPGAAPQRIDLPDVRARMRTAPGVRADDPPDLHPGFVVDGGAAYVADAAAPRIVRVELASGAVTSRPLSAVAAKGGAGRMRSLLALGAERLLLNAQDVAGGRVERTSAQLVQDGRARTLGTGYGAGNAQGIVVPNYRRRFADVFDLRGRRLARHRPRFGITDVVVHGDHAYLVNGARRGADHRTHVIDLRSGRKIGSVPTTRLPRLL